MSGNAVRLVGRLEGHALQSSPSTAGVWFQSMRSFRLATTSLGPLSNVDEWDGAMAAAVYSALGLGTTPPPIEGISQEEQDRELTARARDFYAIDETEWQDMDYSIRGVPVSGDLTLTLRNRPVARAEAKGLRVWEHDEDARNLHALIFKPFRVGAVSS